MLEINLLKILTKNHLNAKPKSRRVFFFLYNIFYFNTFEQPEGHKSRVQLEVQYPIYQEK